MGTNYFLRGDSDELHIGKSSAGWCFSLRIYPLLNINSLEDWKPLFARHQIADEYGVIKRPADMVNIITNRRWSHPVELTPIFYLMNHGEPGPNGLIRSVIDGIHCVGHGSGTWDLFQSEFS